MSGVYENETDPDLYEQGAHLETEDVQFTAVWRGSGSLWFVTYT